MQTFIINDENKINSYGFKVLNAGINLDRFRENPIMLSGHSNQLSSVIGKWNNIRLDKNNLLIADPQFDLDDEAAKAIEGKVSRGFVKGASMGLSFEREHLTFFNGSYVLSKSELMEVSIVAIPSNANAVRLFSQPGILMSEKEVSLSLSVINKNDATLTLIEFQSLSLKEQLDFKERNNKAYLNLFNTKPFFELNRSQINLGDINSRDQFHALSDNEKLKFKLENPTAYNKIWCKK